MKARTLFSFLFISALGFSSAAMAANEDITLSLESLENVSGNGALEVCGTAIHKDKIKPILVTVKHSSSYYTTLTAPNDKWCLVFKRWTYNGKIDVSATTLNKPAEESFRQFDLQIR